MKHKEGYLFMCCTVTFAVNAKTVVVAMSCDDGGPMPIHFDIYNNLWSLTIAVNAKTVVVAPVPRWWRSHAYTF